MTRKKPPIDLTLQNLQRQSFDYFLHEANPDNGLIVDKTAPDWPASIAATGPTLAAYPVGVERGFMPRRTWASAPLAMPRYVRCRTDVGSVCT